MRLVIRAMASALPYVYVSMRSPSMPTSAMSQSMLVPMYR